MKTQTALFSAKALTLGLLVALSGCSGSSSDSSSAGPMYIVSCSLGCGNGAQGIPIGCSLVNIAQNTEVTIQFSQPVDLFSVTASSFRLVNLSNGTVPGGVFNLNPGNAKQLVFRPSLTFSGTGVPEFGFDPNETYQLLILGENQDPNGPWIRSVGGKPNTTRMDCTVQTTEDLIDPVPGDPTSTAYITSELDPVTGLVTYDPDTHLPVGGVLLEGAVGVDTESRIVLLIDDIMNKATIANQLNGQSNTIAIRIDADGDLNTPGDQVVQTGTWAVDVDFENLLRTTAVFTPSGGEFPSGGGDPMAPRLTILAISAQLLDIVGNALDNPGEEVFSTVIVPFIEELITEDFTDTTNEDPNASGGFWGPNPSGGAWTGGVLTYGNGGGSGRLGGIHVHLGETVTLNTDSQLFPIMGQHPSLMTNIDPGMGMGQYDPNDPNSWPTITVDQPGEGFEFSEVQVDNGGIIVLTGSRPGRIFGRGTIVHNGIMNLTGATPLPHLSNSGGELATNNLDPLATAPGGIGGVSGPGGGNGGQGADRIDMTAGTLPQMLNVGGITYPGAVNIGRNGVGVGGFPDGTGGVGGVNWPPTLPLNNQNTHALFGDAEISDVGMGENCRVAMVGGPGSGGSHALTGTVGLPMSPFFASEPGLLLNTPADTPGGDNTNLNLEAPGSPPSSDNKRNLEFWTKHLRGGSGGGGGGTHVYASRSNSTQGPNCGASNFGLFPFFDHSAAGGGGGGGAVMLVAGRKLSVNGIIDCQGGDGGSSTQPGASILLCTQPGNAVGPDPDCEKYAAPGGAGAGGAVRLQAALIEIASIPSRINVTGGIGGQGVGNSLGGDGSPGLVRIEYTGFLDQAADAALWGPSIAPSLPGDPGFNDPFTSAAILSIGEWGVQEFRPESYSGSQSCWMQPAAAATSFGLEFVADIPGVPTDLSRFGWNMDLVYDVAGVGELIFPYRGIPPISATDPYDEDNFPLGDLGGDDFETYFGTTLNHGEPTLSDGSLFVIRFQGVRGSATIADFCDLDLSSSDVTPDSVTPYVSHPSLLNDFSPAPNMIRFAVVFDEQLTQFDPVVAARVRGVSNLRIRVLPN